MVKIFFMYANLLLQALSRRYTFPVDSNFIGSFIQETLTSSVYLDILRGIEVENVREEKRREEKRREERVYRYTVDDGMIKFILVKIRVFSSWNLLDLHN